jgi:hypothetical protein
MIRSEYKIAAALALLLMPVAYFLVIPQEEVESKEIPQSDTRPEAVRRLAKLKTADGRSYDLPYYEVCLDGVTYITLYPHQSGGITAKIRKNGTVEVCD